MKTDSILHAIQTVEEIGALNPNVTWTNAEVINLLQGIREPKPPREPAGVIRAVTLEGQADQHLEQMLRVETMALRLARKARRWKRESRAQTPRFM
jgi:hypothetical protein